MKHNKRYALIICCIFIAHGSTHSMFPPEEVVIPGKIELDDMLNMIIVRKKLLGNFDCINNKLGENNFLEKTARFLDSWVFLPIAKLIESSQGSPMQYSLEQRRQKRYSEIKELKLESNKWVNELVENKTELENINEFNQWIDELGKKLIELEKTRLHNPQQENNETKNLQSKSNQWMDELDKTLTKLEKIPQYFPQQENNRTRNLKLRKEKLEANLKNKALISEVDRQADFLIEIMESRKLIQTNS